MVQARGNTLTDTITVDITVEDQDGQKNRVPVTIEAHEHDWQKDGTCSLCPLTRPTAPAPARAESAEKKGD